MTVRRSSILLALAALGALLLAAPAAFAAAPAWKLEALSDTTAAPGSTVEFHAQLNDVGDGPSDGSNIQLRAALPAGLTAASAHLWDNEFADKRVLDLFAGSGALGFEAASRGAAQVQMVERDKAAAAALRALRDKLHADAVRIHVGDALDALERMDASRFDLVLLDPPFNQDWLSRLWPLLPGVLPPSGLVYVEAESACPAPDGFELLRKSKAGAVHYHLFQVAAAQQP